MTQLRTIALEGESGRKYSFNCYEVVPVFRRKVPCVYYVSRRYEASDGSIHHEPIYLGQTDDFDQCFECHNQYACFKHHHFNCLSILPLNDRAIRVGVKLDLINRLQPIVNGPFNPGWQSLPREKESTYRRPFFAAHAHQA